VRAPSAWRPSWPSHGPPEGRVRVESVTAEDAVVQADLIKMFFGEAS
jgi:hypothetical protein